MAGPPQAVFKRADGLGDDPQLRVGAVVQELFRLPLEDRTGGRQAVAQQLIRSHVQGVGQTYQGGQAELGGAPLDVRDVGRTLAPIA